MRKSNFKILALTAALIMPLSSCKETIIYVTPENTPIDDIKTPIELSVGGVDGAVESSSTRAVITDDENKTYKAFDKNTKIFMVMKSTYGADDYQGSKKDKYTVSRGLVSAGQTNVRFEDGSNQKYWDDAHARSSELDIWAFAQQSPDNWPSYTFQIPDENWEGIETDPNRQKEYKGYTYNDQTSYGWIEHDYNNGSGDKGSKGAIYPCIMVWKVTNETTWKQTTNSVQYQDLMFSNNLTKHGDNPEIDNRLKFNFSTRKFDGGEMKFYHAMSKITINIIEGDGFDKTSDDKDFQFATNTNVKLNGFNTQGTFNIKNGYFEKVDNHEEITSIALSAPKEADPKPYYTLQALAIPNIDGINGITDEYSRFVSDGTNTMMEFTIDNNTFKISSGALYNALHGKIGATENPEGIIPLEAGKNYIFTFKVSKTKIDKITATVAEWEKVTAETVVPKINVTAEVGTKGASSETLTAFDFYMKEGGTTGNYAKYGGKASGTADGTTAWTFTNPIYWPTHDTHYHMRGVAPTLTSISSDKIAVQNKTYNAETSLMIGAPEIAEANKQCGSTKHTQVDMRDLGICAREGNINLNFRYMMSQVEVRLSTTTGDDKVNLTNAKVEVINGYTQANVDLHNRTIVDPSSVADFTLEHVSSENDNYRHSEIVPQALINGTNNLRFKITIYKEGSTTEIDDIYYADIKDINVTEGTSTTSKAITSWEAGKHYIYFLELKKTDIKVSATITDWVTATGSTNVWF